MTEWCLFFFFFFFLLNIFTQDYPLGWVPLQMRGPARNIAQTYKNNIYTKHDMVQLTAHVQLFVAHTMQ